MEYDLSKLRLVALSQSAREGLVLSHRPKDIKLDERGAVLLPDMSVDPNSGLQVGDTVQVERHLLVPWHYHLVPYQVDEYGFDTNKYYRIHKGGGQWEEKPFQLLCFARLHSVRRSQCEIEGLFAVLAGDWPGAPGPSVCAAFPSNKVLLHWVGALKSWPPGPAGKPTDAPIGHAI